MSEVFEFKVDDLAKYWNGDRVQMWANVAAGSHCHKRHAPDLAKYDVLKAVFTKESLQLFHEDKLVYDVNECSRMHANLLPLLRMLADKSSL